MKIIKIYMDRVQAMEPPSRIMGVALVVTCKYARLLNMCMATYVYVTPNTATQTGQDVV